MSIEFEEETSQKTQVYRSLGQGIVILHPQENDPDYAKRLREIEVDIVAVPGLGTDPRECWTRKWKEDSNGNEVPLSSKGNPRQFNWLRDGEGLASEFPQARIMLYDYASAWRGKYKVRATLKSICTWFLDDLLEKRKETSEMTRPLIFIGHSMGGIVIAKSICMAKARKEYEAIVTCTLGCTFFGVPFKGSDMAKIALLYSDVFGSDAYESLLSFMKTEKNDVLDEVRDDFLEISNKLVPPVHLFCVWEQVATVVDYAGRVTSQLPALLQHKSFTAGARKVLEVGLSAFGTSTHFVTMESAVLPGSKSVGMSLGHSDLVKFKNTRSGQFQQVRSALADMIRDAKASVRKRTLAFGQKMFAQKFVNQVRESLEGVDMRQKFRLKAKQRQLASWLTDERAFQDWQTTAENVEVYHPFLWLKGGPGLGKTNACLSAIQQIESDRTSRQQSSSIAGGTDNFLAYFLCESSAGCCTAEDLLKSLITQVINQDESLAQHAKWLVPSSQYRGSWHNDRGPEDVFDSSTKATATVDNLWKCMDDIVSDPAVGSVHIIVSNIHRLEASESTTALLAKIREHIYTVKMQQPASRRVKWIISSRNERHLTDVLAVKGITVIDMENDHEYGGKIRAARRQYAKDAVQQLRTSKEYNADLAYYIRNSIERRSEDQKWIDVLCKLLAAMPDGSSDLLVRRRLKEISTFNIPQMVENSWRTVLKQTPDAVLELEELLQVLTISYEPPSLADLAVLTQVEDVQQLRDLINRCSPLIKVGDWNEFKDRVIFANGQFAECMTTMLHVEDDSKKQFHGLMALRCFKHIKSIYGPQGRRGSDGAAATLHTHTASTTARVSADDQVMEVTNEDEELNGANDGGTRSVTTSLYPVKYLFHHLSEAPPDAVQELFEDEPAFWGLRSDLKDGWLADFQRLTTDFKDLDVGGMSALHVAAGIGANELLSALLAKIGAEALHWTNDDGMTLLHVAAHNNQLDIIDTLVKARADIEAGEQTVGTPLHYAALRGHCNVMAKLIGRHANVNATSEEYGPVLNAAILSGKVDAVKQIMSSDVRFDFDYDRYKAPISLAAGISEPSLFKDILETGKEKWRRNVKLLDQALVKAAYGGRLESLRILLNFQHVYTNNTIQEALLNAAQEKNWPLVDELLVYAMDDRIDPDQRRDINMNIPFYLATVSREELLMILAKMWDFTKGNIAQDVIDFSLYEATVLKKNGTALWLLDTCAASANALAERPSFLETIEDHVHAMSVIDLGNPLNAAAKAGNMELVRSLHQKGAEIDGRRGFSLQLASSEGHIDVVEYLLSHGAEVNREAPSDQDLGFYSVTALQAACDNSRQAVVNVLLRQDADPNLGGGPLTNPITAATQGSDSTILKLLLDADGIDVNVIGGEDHSTPLINAATNNISVECVELLLKKGADVNAKNAAGDTALIMAAYKGNERCVELLCREGADVTHQSPNYGLAIQAASLGSSVQSARVLAENMGGAIETFRAKVKSDHEKSKRDLSDAKSEIEECNHMIQALKLDLEEANDRLESAKREIYESAVEKQTLLSERTLQGTAYQSVGEQLKAIKFERDELQKQLDAEKGQYLMTQHAATELRQRLDEERTRSAQLRTRSGFTALEEKKAIIVDLEEEKKTWLEKFAQAESERTSMQTQIQELQTKLEISEQEAASARDGTVAAMAELESNRVESSQAQEELVQLKASHKELQETLASVQAAASGKKKSASEIASPGEHHEERSPFSREGSTLGFDDFVAPISSPLGSPYQAVSSSPGEITPGAASPFGSALVSPSFTASNGTDDMVLPKPSGGKDCTSPGFRTIHGQHRADGSMGGYVNGGGTRRKHSGIQGQGNERKSTSTGSFHSDGSTIGSGVISELPHSPPMSAQPFGSHTPNGSATRYRPTAARHSSVSRDIPTMHFKPKS